MNNSIRNLIDKPIQPFGSFEAINAEKSLKRKYEKIDSGSELAETANLSGQPTSPPNHHSFSLKFELSYFLIGKLKKTDKLF